MEYSNCLCQMCTIDRARQTPYSQIQLPISQNLYLFQLDPVRKTRKSVPFNDNLWTFDLSFSMDMTDSLPHINVRDPPMLMSCLAV